MRLLILQLSCRLSGNTSHHPSLSAHYKPDLTPCDFWLFPKAKISIERQEICEYDGHTLHKLSQRRLAAD
jgi:hypothetical protein